MVFLDFMENVHWFDYFGSSIYIYIIHTYIDIISIYIYYFCYNFGSCILYLYICIYYNVCICQTLMDPRFQLEQ